MQLQLPDHSLSYKTLRSMVGPYGRIRLGRWILVVRSLHTPDEISIYVRTRLIAVLNADGEVYLDTHHVGERGVAALYDRLMADNGYSTRMAIRGRREITLLDATGKILQAHVRQVSLRPDGPIEMHA